MDVHATSRRVYLDVYWAILPLSLDSVIHIISRLHRSRCAFRLKETKVEVTYDG